MAHDQPAFVSGALAFMIVVVINIPLGYVQTLSLGLFSEHTLFAIRGFLRPTPQLAADPRHRGAPQRRFPGRPERRSGQTQDPHRRRSGGPDGAVHPAGLAALVYILFTSWQLTLISLVVTPLLFLVLPRLRHADRQAHQRDAVRDRALNSVAQDGLDGLPISKSFNLVEILDERFRQANDRVVRKGLGVARLPRRGRCHLP